jgi:hypothetical protein
VNPAPTGPGTPAGGWSVALADHFEAPLGTAAGDDNIFYPNLSYSNNPAAPQYGCNNFELEAYSSSQVQSGNGQLVLSATPDNDVLPASGGRYQANYISGAVTTSTDNTAEGWKGFDWIPNKGETWAFEIDAKFPVNTDDLWNAFWTSTENGWYDERDFFEGRPTTDEVDSDNIYNTNFAQDWYQNSTPEPFALDGSFNRYTYVIYPNGSWSFYINGTLQTWVGNNGIAPAETPSESNPSTPMELLMNYALDYYNGNSYSDTDPNFTSGTRQFIIKSAAVYEDGNHAGQDYIGGGIAPGTTILPTNTTSN